jgi:hypothetical protein
LDFEYARSTGMQDQIQIRFLDKDPSEASSLAESLRAEILDAAPNAEVRRLREDPEAMDFGATLVLVLGSSAASAISHGIAIWLARNAGVNLKITTKDGEVLADHVSSKNAAEMVGAVFDRKT